MKRIFSAFLSLCMVILMSACGSSNVTATNDPITLKIWHYYNSEQQLAFDKLLEKFNQSVGLKNGIYVEGYSKGNINDLTNALMEAVKDENDLDNIPNMATIYSDMAFELDKKDKIISLNDYITDEELKKYVPSYIKEGIITGDNLLKIFPTVKSTEVLYINKTVWDKFKSDTSVTENDLLYWETLKEVAEKYYKWSNGEAFFGRDSLANYLLVGSSQLGHEIFSSGNKMVELDKKTLKTLWDNHYVPNVKGYFASYGKYRSDDMKVGKIIAYTGSTTSANYFPNITSDSEGNTSNIEPLVLPLPNFMGYGKTAITQGAGISVLKSNKEQEEACVLFLKWFTEPAQNIQFAVDSGYIPVIDTAEARKALNPIINSDNFGEDSKKQALTVSLNMRSSYNFYASKPFDNSFAARKFIEDSLYQATSEAVKAVEESMESQGISRDEASIPYLSDELFDKWFSNIEKEFNKMEILTH